MKRLFKALDGKFGWSLDHDQVECTLATSRSVQKFTNGESNPENVYSARPHL